MASSGAGSPCGACKFLRRRCIPSCVFAPYFCSDLVRPFSPPSTRCSELATSRNCCSSSRSNSASPPCFPSPSKLKQEWKTPFMVASPTSLLCNNRYHGAGNQLPPAPFPAADLNATNHCTSPQNSGGFWAPPEIYTGEEAVPLPAEESSMQRASPSDVGELQALALRMTKTEPSF